MLKCIFFCLSYYAIFANANLAPFIDPCYLDDKACLIASTQKAIPHFAKGVPSLGIEPMDPCKLDRVLLQEGALKVVFTNVVVTGASKCQVLNVEVDQKNSKLIVEVDCPINVEGDYVGEGVLLFGPIEGNGRFKVHTNKLFLSVHVDLSTVDGDDGQKYWKVTNPTAEFEAKEKTTLDFQNLFNGDQAKAAPVLKIFDENWKEIVQNFAKPLIDEVIEKNIVTNIQNFTSKVPITELYKTD